MSRPVSIIHLSDLHLRSNPRGTPDSRDALGSSNYRTVELVRYIDDKYPDAHVVITGDITDSGTAASYRRAQEHLGHWLRPGRLSVVPGNHDCGPLGAHVIPKRKRAFLSTFSKTLRGGTQQPFPWVKPMRHVVLIGLDSTADGSLLARGGLGEAQLARLHDILNEARVRSRTSILLLHHHPFSWNLFTALDDADELLDTISGPRVDLVLFGHKHNAGRRRVNGITFLASPSSVEASNGRLRFRAVTISEDGRITTKWDGISVVEGHGK